MDCDIIIATGKNTYTEEQKQTLRDFGKIVGKKVDVVEREEIKTGEAYVCNMAEYYRKMLELPNNFFFSAEPKVTSSYNQLFGESTLWNLR